MHLRDLDILIKLTKHWMTEELTDHMSYNRAIEWDKLIIKLEKVPKKLSLNSKKYLAILVDEFCMDTPRYGISPWFAHYILCYCKHNLDDAREILIANKWKLENIEESYEKISEFQRQLDLNRNNQNNDKIYEAIKKEKEKIRKNVYERNEQLRDFKNIPYGFQPTLELHNLMQDQIEDFIEEYLGQYLEKLGKLGLGKKYKG
ncbi:uncharacterized protein CELE_K10G4.3 [Caenorhabditis elegans]|uniref:Uncharacterized protein n=1 Tax=Caenorhabditis elegans TaxID=6239 RepID=O45672_CAEEL|nr:Uncharacterized protein CELE_K10G4.3 [Caenorhabditis elegans]CAB07256.1 Uncharacterized protein CELE_K10G4.3 [Caenorhabditis elegans]|eukprot:NP_507374.1 Uncharacterized protein CELE_K10G4.3 [Caenorhabditis elegans]